LRCGANLRKVCFHPPLDFRVLRPRGLFCAGGESFLFDGRLEGMAGLSSAVPGVSTAPNTSRDRPNAHASF
jgi:hypothetical protein